MPESPEEWYRSLPKVTRGWLTAAFATTVAVQLELLSPMMLHLDFPALTGKLELWRLVTNFCFFGKFGFPFVFSLFFLIRYGRELEAKRFEGRTADFVWAMLFMGAVQVSVAFLLGGLPFMAQSMLTAVVYLWSREYAETVLSIFGLFNVQAFYFPWVRCSLRACRQLDVVESSVCPSACLHRRLRCLHASRRPALSLSRTLLQRARGGSPSLNAAALAIPSRRCLWRSAC